VGWYRDRLTFFNSHVSIQRLPNQPLIPTRVLDGDSDTSDSDNSDGGEEDEDEDEDEDGNEDHDVTDDEE